MVATEATFMFDRLEAGIDIVEVALLSAVAIGLCDQVLEIALPR